MQSIEDFETFRLLTILSEDIELYRERDDIKGKADAIRSFNSMASKFKMFPKDRDTKKKTGKKLSLSDSGYK